MAGEIASAFVRIRPNMTGFKAETESGVRGAFAGIGKLTAGLFAIGGTVETLKKIAEAAAGDQAAFAVLDKAVENSGASNRIYGKSIEEVLAKQARLRGFSDEELASSFVRIVSATKNSAKAYHDLGLAEDVARARHIGVAQAAIAISKAEQGVTTALQRLGIVVHPVTAAVDALKSSHDQAAASGAKFTKSEDLAYKAALVNAKAQDAVASRAQTIATIQARFGGSAAAFANTASGAWARLHEQVHQFEEFLGKQVLPALTRGANAAGTFIEKLTHNQGLKTGLTQGLTAIRDVAKTIGPPLLVAAQAVKTLVSTLGVVPLIAFAAAFKAVGVVVSVNTAIQTRWAAAKAAATAAQAGGVAADDAATAAETALTRALTAAAAAMIASTEATTANVAASGADVVATESLTAAKTALAVAQGEGAVAAEGATVAQAGALTTLRSGLLGLVGGPIGLVTLGIAGLAAGFAYAVTRETAFDRATKATTTSLQNLATAQQRARDVRSQIDQNRTQIGTDKTAVDQARLTVEQQKAALASSGAAKGSLDYRAAVLSVTSAVQAYHAAVKTLADDQRHAGALQDQLANQTQRAKQATNDSIAGIERLGASYRDKLAASIDIASRRGNTYLAQQQRARLLATETSDRVAQYVSALEKQSSALQASSPMIAENTLLLSQYADRIGRIPSARETRIILNNKDATTTLKDLITTVIPNAMAKSQLLFSAGGTASGAAYSSALAAGLGSGVAQGAKIFGFGLDAVGKLLSDLPKKTAKTAKDAAAKTSKAQADAAAAAAKDAADALKAAQDNINSVSQSAQDSIASAAQGVASAQQNLASVIANGKTQINDAVTSAKQNLASIGQKIASDINDYLTNKGGSGPLTGPAAKEFAKLSALLKSGKGTADLQRQAQAFASQLQGQAAKETFGGGTKSKVDRTLSDLVDQFAKGAETPAAVARLNRAVRKILTADHITYKQVAKERGVAFADELFAQIDALGKQATALRQGPRRPGLTGLEPTIVRPEQAVIQSQKDIAAAQQSLQQSQLSEAKTQTSELRKIAKATSKLDALQKGRAYTDTLHGHRANDARHTTKTGVRPR